jgi:hypothetical protein
MATQALGPKAKDAVSEVTEAAKSDQWPRQQISAAQKPKNTLRPYAYGYSSTDNCGLAFSSASNAPSETLVSVTDSLERLGTEYR